MISPLRQSVTSFTLKLVNTAHETTKNSLISLGFVVQNIHIEGLENTVKPEVLTHIDIKPGDCIFYVDTQRLATNILTISWIKKVSIHTHLPNTLNIELKEFQPYALWQYHGKVTVITENGAVIPSANPKSFGALPLVIGKDANSHCKQLLNIFTDYPNLRDLLASIQYMYERRWRLHFISGTIVDLPEDDIGDTLHKLHVLHQQQKILDRDVKIIDMRIKDRLIIKGSSVVGRQKS